MANNLIQIKRSTTTANASSLANGELAFTSNGDVLWIGSNGTTIPIAGKRYPGTLTANQALVANSTSGIDKIIVANLVPTVVWANGAAGSAGQVLSSNSSGGVYWYTPAPGVTGSNTEIQFNDEGALGSNASFTFDKASSKLTVGNSTVNTVINSSSIAANSIAVRDTTVSSNTTSGALTVAGGLGVAGKINTGELAAGNTSVYSSMNGTNISTANVFATATVNALVLSVGGWVIANQSGVFTSGVVNGDILQVGTAFRANTTQVTVGSSIGLSANGSLGTANQVLRSTGSGIYWADDAGDISGVTAGNGLSGGGTSGDVTLSVSAGDGLTVNSSGVHVGAANGISVSADAVGVSTGDTLTVNATGIHVNTTLSITSVTTSGDLTVNGNTKLGDTSADVVSINGVVNTNIMPAANATYNVGNNTMRWFEVHAANVHSEQAFFDGDVTIGGNLYVSGNLTSINVATLSVTDSLIQLASNNTLSDSIDIGLYGNYQTGGGAHEHTGLFRDATDGIWKLFFNLTEAPTTTVNVAGGGYTTATLESYLLSGGLVSNATHVAITANATVNVAIVANTLSLTTALPATSGGTGTGTYAVGDLLVGNTSNSLTKLSAGSDGYVLQINGSGVVAWNTLDGGTF